MQGRTIVLDGGRRGTVLRAAIAELPPFSTVVTATPSWAPPYGTTVYEAPFTVMVTVVGVAVTEMLSALLVVTAGVAESVT